jgi:hypothetical protein
MIHYDRKDLFVVREGKATLGLTLGLTQSFNLLKSLGKSTSLFSLHA